MHPPIKMREAERRRSIKLEFKVKVCTANAIESQNRLIADGKKLFNSVCYYFQVYMYRVCVVYNDN